MTQQRRGLGKGLGALIQATTSPSEPESVAAGAADPRSPYTPSQPGGASDESADAQPIVGAYFAEVATGSITPNPRQPRTTFDEDALDELASSIREVGLLQPVVVRQVMPGHYELIMGERRWRASQRADLKHIPARAVAICGWRQFLAGEDVARTTPEIHALGPIYLRASDPELKLERKDDDDN